MNSMTKPLVVMTRDTLKTQFEQGIVDALRKHGWGAALRLRQWTECYRYVDGKNVFDEVFANLLRNDVIIVLGQTHAGVDVFGLHEEA
jgi:hypothetical protein